MNQAVPEPEPPEVDTSSTDDDAAVLTCGDEEWLTYETDVNRYAQSLDPRAAVTHNVKRRGLISGVVRQIDSLAVGTTGGEEFEIAIECKRYSKKLGIGKIDEFAGKLEDIGVDRGVMYAFSGVTRGAAARAANAKQPKIGITAIPTLASLHLPGWLGAVRGLPHFGDCANQNCMTGDVSWEDWDQPEGSAVRAGSCNTCGTWAVTCSECSDVSEFFNDEVHCYGCGAIYGMTSDRDGIPDGVTRILGEAG